MPIGAGKTLLRQLLSERNQFPERIAAIDRRLREMFERDVAMLALDMSGFSRLTARYGVMHYLGMIEQMEEAARPAVIENCGQVIKCEADDLFAIFPTPRDALEGALDIFRAFDAMSSVVPPERDIRGSIGIGFGPTLVIDEEDLFGEQMNYACKLGEDLAAPGEILLTDAAHGALPPGLYRSQPIQFTIEGQPIGAHRFEAKLFVDP